MRHEGDVIWRFAGSRELAQQFRSLGRLLIGELRSTLSPGVTTVAREYRRDNGLRVRVELLLGSPPIVEIDVRDMQSLLKREKATLWLPEGFVVYPASEVSPPGWGLPLVQVEDALYPPDEQAFAPANLRPGLDVSRWTPGGILGQVLLTRLVDAGFPPEETDRETVVISPAYHPIVGPVPGTAVEPQLGDWKAYRLELKPFTAQTLASEDRQRELEQWKRDTFKLLNAHRESVGREPILPPLRGKADAAQPYAEFAFATNYSGHMVGEFGSTYKTYNDRASKLGGPAIEYSGWVADYTMGEAVAFYGGDILVTFAQSYVTEYSDATGFPVRRAVQPFYEISPTLAVSSWLDSPRHRSYIEWDGYDISDQALTASFMNLGYRTGNAAAVFVREAQWVQCGNRFWHSRHKEVPTLSWRGFQSENLAYETWPVLFEWTREGEEGSYTYRARKILRYPFTLETTTVAFPTGVEFTLTGTNGFTYGPASEYAAGFINSIPRAHYLAGEIYARGQVLAIAPDSGLVLAAAVAKVGESYRLLALCHHRADEPADETNEGATRYLRFWYADIPKDDPILFDRDGKQASLPFHARTVIRKKFGQENDIDAGPWNEVNQVNSWKGGQLIDVGTTGRFSAPDLTKYDSLWRFDNEGRAALCVRSSFDPAWFEPITLGQLTGSDPEDPGGPQVPLPDYGQLMLLYTRLTDATGRNNRSLAQNMEDTVTNAGFQITKASHFALPSGQSIICRLDFSHASGSSASFSWALHGQGEGYDRFFYESTWPLYTQVAAAVPDDPEDFFGPCPIRYRPLVAYFNESGEERALFEVSSFVTHRHLYPGANEFGYYDTVQSLGAVVFRGLVRGPAHLSPSAARALLPSVQHFSGDVELSDGDVLCHEPAVFYVDDADLAYGLAGAAPRLRQPAGFNPYIERSPWYIGGAQTASQGGIIVESNPEYTGIGNIAPDETRPIWRYALWHNGRRVHYQTATNPQADYPHASLTFYFGMGLRGIPIAADIWSGGAWSIGFVMQPLVCGNFQGGFAKSRDGEWVFGVTLCRQVLGAMRRLRDDAPFPENPAVAQWVHYNTAGTVVAYFLHQRFMASFQNTGRPENFGGYIEASFASQAELAQMMQIPGANVRSFYARIV